MTWPQRPQGGTSGQCLPQKEGDKENGGLAPAKKKDSILLKSIQLRKALIFQRRKASGIGVRGRGKVGVHFQTGGKEG